MTSCFGIDVGIRNLSYCVLQRDEKHTYKIREWKLIDVMSRCDMSDTSCKKLTSGQIHDIADFILPSIFPPEFLTRYQIAHVSIEQQPHGKYGNQKIILFSHLFYDYFAKLRNAQTWGSCLTSVVFTGAAQKYNSTWLQQHVIPKPKTYPQRKSTSIKLCQKLCTLYELTALPQDSKRDDLADSFLLALVVWERWS